MQEPEIPGLIPGQSTFVSPSAGSKYVHLLLVDSLGGPSLPRNSGVKLTDCPYMTIAVYSGLKATKYQTDRVATVREKCLENEKVVPKFEVII